MTNADEVRELLLAFVRAQLPGATDVEVRELRRTSQGYSRENWPFDAVWRVDGRVVEAPLIMRRDPVGSVLETDRRVEFEVLRAMARTDVPVPGVRWLEEDGSWLGRPSVVMDRLDGVCDWFVMNGPRPLDERLDFAGRYLELLARMHAVDWRAAGLGAVLDDPGPGTAAAERAIAEWEDVLRRNQLEPYPELDLVAAWLRANTPSCDDVTLVHADVKPGNMLLDGGTGIVAMLDWELAHLGDPLEDVGWITNPLRAREHQIAGVWEREQIVQRYSELTGRAVPADALRFWNVFANYKLTVISLTGVRSFVDGRADRIMTSPNALVRLMFDMIGV